MLPRPSRVAAGAGSRAARGGDFEAFRCREEEDIFRAEIARRAQELGLQPLRWPDTFPFDSALAMRVATYAKSIGRAVPFAQAAFRQAFAGGHSLDEMDHVLIAAAACEMHPEAVLQGRRAALRTRAAERCHGRGRAAGVTDVPAIRIGDTQSGVLGRVFVGERAVEEAAAYMRAPVTAAHAMKANRAYRLIVTRGGRAPALLADAGRVDHIEVVEIDSGEVVLFWDRPPHAASRLARALRSDLAQLEAEEFLARWSSVDV